MEIWNANFDEVEEKKERKELMGSKKRLLEHTFLRKFVYLSRGIHYNRRYEA